MNLVICGNSSKSKARKIFGEALINISEGNVGGFNGILNGYHRPYHYFYDKIYPSLDLLQEEKRLSYFDLPGAFISLDEIADVFDKTESYEKNGFYLMPSKSRYSRTPRKHFEALKSIILAGDYELGLKINNFDYVFWFGLSLEKRIFLEREFVILSVIEYINKKYKNALFVFDGLTRLPTDSKEEFVKSKCYREQEIFDEIYNSFPEACLLNLIGATAKEKIIIASNVDFYFCSYLTDSLWCSAIGARPGIAYRPKSAFGRGSFLHPLTHEVPKNMVRDVGETSTGDYDGQDISIDPNYLVNALKLSIDLTLSLNKWIGLLKNSVRSGARVQISPRFHVPFIKGRKVSFRFDDYYRNIESLIFRIKDINGNTIFIDEIRDMYSTVVSEDAEYIELIVVINNKNNWRPGISASVSL